MKPRKLMELSMLTAVALCLAGIENLIPAPVAIPGIKLGLANIITLVMLPFYNPLSILTVLVLRIFLNTLLFGQFLSFSYSMAGGLFCLLVTILLHRFLQGHFIFLTSVFGALAHNAMQLCVACLLTGTTGVFVYAPTLFISGLVTGLFTGLCAHFLLPYLKRLQDSV